MKKWKSYVRSYLVITIAAAIYALAFNIFYAPNDIAFGGVTGIAQMINRLFSYPPVGVLIIALNVPLFLLAWKLLGKQMLFGSLYAMLLSSVLLDIFGSTIQFPTLDEPIMACIFGGVFLGLASGLICREGASLGGTDISSRLIRLKFPTISVGKMLMILDVTVVCGVSIVFRQLNSALMGIVALYIATNVMDRVLFGADPSKVAYIISDRSQEIARTIIKELHRGVTVLHGEGAWSGAEKNVLLCAFRGRQIVTLKNRIKEIDPKAFLIVCNAYEVLGDGFLPHDPKVKKASALLPESELPPKKGIAQEPACQNESQAEV